MMEEGFLLMCSSKFTSSLSFIIPGEVHQNHLTLLHAKNGRARFQNDVVWSSYVRK